MTLHPTKYSSIHLCIWLFLLASLPLFVISAIWIIWCWKEHSKQYHHSEGGFQRGLCTLVLAFFEEGYLSTFSRSLCPFELVLDSFILFFPVKAFIDVNPQ